MRWTSQLVIAPAAHLQPCFLPVGRERADEPVELLQLVKHRKTLQPEMSPVDVFTRPVAAEQVPQAGHAGVEDFFCRIDGFDITPGWKSAGFFLTVSTGALRQLRQMEASSEHRQALLDRVHERLSLAGVLPKKAVQFCGLSFVGISACPHVFTTDPTMGASLGGNPRATRAALG
jgi:hypothetical protein